jgi:hypothetical protein
VENPHNQKYKISVAEALDIVEYIHLIDCKLLFENCIQTPEWRSAEDWVAPRSPTAKEPAEIWVNLLRLGRVGVHDNFLSLEVIQLSYVPHMQDQQRPESL